MSPLPAFVSPDLALASSKENSNLADTVSTKTDPAPNLSEKITSDFSSLPTQPDCCAPSKPSTHSFAPPPPSERIAPSSQKREPTSGDISDEIASFIEIHQELIRWLITQHREVADRRKGRGVGFTEREIRMVGLCLWHVRHLMSDQGHLLALFRRVSRKALADAMRTGCGYAALGYTFGGVENEPIKHFLRRLSELREQHHVEQGKRNNAALADSLFDSLSRPPSEPPPDLPPPEPSTPIVSTADRSTYRRQSPRSCPAPSTRRRKEASPPAQTQRLSYAQTLAYVAQFEKRCPPTTRRAA